MQSTSSRKRNGLLFPLAAIFVAAFTIISAPGAHAISLSMTPSGSVPSGQARVIGAAWGEQSPYNVTFRCNVSGCSDFVSSSTTTTSLARSPRMTTCTGVSRTHTISVTERGGGRLNAQSTTTWTRASVC